VHARRITTSRADNAMSSTTPAAKPAVTQGASSPPVVSIHQSVENRAAAAAIAATMYPVLEGIRAREGRLRPVSLEARGCERAVLGKN
ncbi:MAG: hypothetical protein ACREBC_07485, partial [Pyrinomonadaceae bacterium]